MNRLAFLILILTPALGARGADDASRRDLDALQGTWSMVSLEIKGRTIPAERLAGRVALIDGKTFTDRNGEKTLARGTIAVDASKTPATIDTTFTEGSLQGKTSLAIYKLDGATLTTCSAGPGDPRPTRFVTAAEGGDGAGHMLATYTRAKP